MTLEQDVHRALSTRVVNGHDLDGWTDFDLATDLVAFDNELDGEHPYLVLRFVRIWPGQRSGCS